MFYLPIIAFYLLFTWLSWKNAKWGLFIIIALLPSYLIRFSILEIPLTLLEGMIWILFIVWLIKIKQEKKLTFNPLKILKNIFSPNKAEVSNPIPKSFRWPIVLLLIAATVSLFISPNLREAAGIWKAYFVEALLFFIIFVYEIKTKKDLQNIIKFLGLTVIGIGIFALIQKFTGWLIPNPFWAAEETRRVTTFFGYPNANALFVAPILILTLYNLLTEKGKWLIYQSLILILGILTTYWTKSAGALIGLAAGLIALLIFYKKTRLASLIIILLISGLTFIWDKPKNYLQKMYIDSSQTYLTDAPSDWQLRTQQWRETINLLQERPLLGSGLAGYQTEITPYHRNRHIEIFIYPHNFFLNFWTETGILGLISIIWLLIVFFITAFRKNHGLLNLVLASAMITLLIHGLVDVPYFKNDLSVLFWIIIGMTVVLYNLRRIELKK